MPVSLPTVYALQFVKNNNLSKRIRVLQQSYKLQYASFFSVSLFNLKHLLYHPNLDFYFNYIHLLY